VDTTQKTSQVRASTARPSGASRGTGRDRDEWFALLDAWGASGRRYREIADWLTTEHGVSDWWAQKLVVEYQQARGVRAPGIRPDGTFTIGVSRIVAAPVDEVYAAFVEPERRRAWLPGSVLRERTTATGRSARFDWGEDGATRINVAFVATSGRKTQVAVEHVRLPDARAAEREKEAWRGRLADLIALLEEGLPNHSSAVAALASPRGRARP
jgi:hypothetical protein